MGLFDLFKNKNNAPDNNPGSTNELFLSINKYSEYIVRFIGMQHQGNYAPISAYEKNNGAIVGFLFINTDNTYTLSAEEVIQRMEKEFESKLASKEIKSYAILYHSQYAHDDNHAIATEEAELKAISVSYHFAGKSKGAIALPYIFKGNEISYTGFKNFTDQENNVIFNTQLKENKDYFQDRIEIKSESIENEIGLKITKSNTCDLGNTWGGIFGFENYRNGPGSEIIKEYFINVLNQPPSYYKHNVRVSEMDFSGVLFKTIVLKEQPLSVIPVIKTDYSIIVENKEINEWENVQNMEAVITGSGRDTFGIKYFATDYAENREQYLTNKKLHVKLSGILYVLDVHKKTQTESEVNFSDDFTGYMPNDQLSNQGCFDFIGQLEDFKETLLLEDKSLKGYILKVKLINHEEVKDFFTIDMYVAPENMRFKELTAGMKVTGMFQLQGCLAS